VFAEALSVIGRRLNEQRRTTDATRLFEALAAILPANQITWISGQAERLLPEIIATCQATGGELNYNDALIALMCDELGVRYIVSFDSDFDRLPTVVRVATPDALSAVLA